MNMGSENQESLEVSPSHGSGGSPPKLALQVGKGKIFI